MSAPPPKKGAKDTKDGQISKLVRRLKGDKTAYWMNKYLRCNMGLTDSCRMKGINCFGDTSKVDMDESTWNSETYELDNK